MENMKLPYINQVMITGRFAQKPVLQESTKIAGLQWVNFAIANNYRSKQADGTKKVSTYYIKCVAYGSVAKFINDFGDQGKAVYVVGRLHNDVYQNASGIKTTNTNIIVKTIEILTKDKKPMSFEAAFEEELKSEMIQTEMFDADFE